MAAEAQIAQRVALVAGGTGLTGGELVTLLLRNTDFARVHAVTRRPLPLDHPRLANRILKLEELGPRVAGLRCTDAFCCIGAPQGPRASVAELRKVDLELVLTFARAAQSVGATRMVIVSAARADRAAAGAFQRIKGEMEAALRELKFSALDLLQPGPVLGLRPQSGLSELLRMALLPMANPLLHGKFEPARAISGADLAAAMLGASRSQRRGVYAYSGRTLQELVAVGRRPV